jgi:putative salt-induced outer membrane protein
MKKSILILALAAAGGIATTAQAGDAQWSGSGQLGFSMTSGNSDTENLSAGLSLKRETERWVSDMSLDLLRASNDDIDTAERYTVNTKTGYKFDDNDYGYYGTRYDQDKFSGFDYTMTTTVGWGHKFHDNKESRLITEVGLGYRTEALDIDRTENNGMVLAGKLDYMRQLTETIKFEDVLVVEAGDDNSFVQNDLGFSFKVSEKFAVKLAHQIRHSTEAPVGKESTDTLVSANLVYDF